MPPMGSKKNKPTKTPSKLSFSSDPLASSTPPPSQPSTHDHTSSLLQSASRQYPSLISDSAFIGRIADVTPQSNGHDATIWLSESALLAASILPGSLVSVCLASSNKMSSTESSLDSLLDECCKISGIDVGNSMTGEVGCFFALAVVFPSCKVMKDGVRISWGLSCTMGGPSNGRVVFVSPMECQTTVDCLNWTSKLLNSTEIKIRLFKCKDLHLELVSSNIRQHVHSEISSLSDIAVVRANDQFGNDHFSSPKTPSSQSNLTLGRFDESSPNVNYCTGTFDVSAIRIALEDKQTKELLQISSSWWLSSRILLHGNLVTIPLCGQPCMFLVREATPVLVENSGQDLVQGKENDLTLVDYVNAAFVVEPKTKVYLLPAPMESRNKVGLSLVEEESIAVSKLGGLSKEFSELKEIIFEKIHYSANYTGVLLHGPPGTGKTSLAHSCAHGAGVKLFLVNGPEIISQEYGKSEQALYKVFADASREAPAVVFIDELDAIAPARKDGGESLSHRMVATLLNLMDESKTGSLLVIAATSKPDNIDSALRRHGRFDREIEIGVPSKDQRLDILLTLLNEMEHSLLDTEIQYLASTTHGFVGADLASLCNEAALTSLRRYINTKRSYNYSESDLGHMHNVDSLPSLLSNLTLSPSHFLSHGCADKVTERPNTFHDVFHCESTNGGGVNEELLKITLDDFERAKTKVRPSAMREVMVEVPNVSWEDIGGQEEVKKQLREAVEWPQKHQVAFEHIGIRPPTGVLMFGPPGCSKTLMARAVASNAGLNFLSVKGPELFSKWVGESEKAVRSLFSKARAAAPSIIFFDEIDGLAITRGTENDGASVGDRVMSQLLVELDGLNKRVDVTVIAATNRPDKIDPAILRPGRFDRLLYVGPPNESDREAIFRIHLRKMPCSSEVSLKELAHLTEGCTGADIFSICREAALVALEEDLNILEISMAHFKIAIRSVHPSEVHSYEKFSSKFQRLVGSDGSRDGSRDGSSK